ILFPRLVGHSLSDTREIVSVSPAPGGMPVARDPDGNVLGVLGEYKKGRTAILGFGPEQEKYFDQPEVGRLMLRNLLEWLLEQRLRAAAPGSTGVVHVALPRRARVATVSLNGKRVPNPAVRRRGSLCEVTLNVSSVPPNGEAEVRITYPPLKAARNVERIIHLPWASLSRGGPPRKLAEWLASLHATVCQPLLRGSDGHAWYRGMPEDTPDPVTVTDYPGDFLADFIAECRGRSIRVIGGIYFESRTTLRRHPEAAVVGRDGKRSERQACFNRPEGQEYNLETVRQLLQSYRLDGVILDDNFELESYGCCCDVCRAGFRAWCEARGVPFVEPQSITGGEAARHWSEYKRDATRRLAEKVDAIARQYGTRAGGWVGTGAGTAYLAGTFGFLGGMVYVEPPRAARLMLSLLDPDQCEYFTLLWGPGVAPERLEEEARQAIHAGSTTVGFWVYPP
ncbi:MAG: hypothetical protein QHJ73_19190, partial [Armatimonadota bacterium]|nr:hypothetical protein [Armatimonadota bacterium]